MRFNMFKGLKGIFVVGLLSLLTTLSIVHAETVDEFIDKLTLIVAPQLVSTDSDVTIDNLLDARRLSQETADAARTRIAQGEDIDQAFAELLVCEIIYRDFDACQADATSELAARGFDLSGDDIISDNANIIADRIPEQTKGGSDGPDEESPN